MRSSAHKLAFALALGLPAALAAPSQARAACPQLLMNSEFTDGVIGPWALDVSPPATLMSMVTNDQYKTLDVTLQNFTGGGTPTGELFQSVAIKYGERYRVSFYMYTGQSSTMARVAIHDATDPGKTYGLNDSFQVSTNFSSATQSFTFVAPAGDPDAVFSIYLPIDTFAFYRFDSLFVENISAPECTNGETGGASGNGGVAGTGGTPGSGGVSGSGGAPGSGGRASAGGAPATGGAPDSGGGSSSGGATGMAGRGAAGGATSNGGTTGKGGLAGESGGATGTGNATGSTGGDRGTLDGGGRVGGTGVAGTGGGATGAGGAGLACVPGAQAACACPGATAAHGVQLCNAQGTGYGVCTACPDAGTAAARGGSQGCGCTLASSRTDIVPWWTAWVLLVFRRGRTRQGRRARRPTAAPG